MKYTVVVRDTSRTAYHEDWRDRVHTGLSITRARKIVERAARTGARLYNKSGIAAIHRDNWGSRGGSWPVAYRQAMIYPDGWSHA